MGEFFIKIMRILEYLPLLWKDFDWCESFLLKLLDLKLKRMQELNLSDPWAREGAAREIAVVRSHIDHFLNIEKYHPIKGEAGMKDGKFWYTRDFHNSAVKRAELEDWHWAEIWRKISRKGRQWWI